MLKAQKEAEKAINKDIAVGAVKQVGKKAGKDALKVMLVSALFTLLKEIMNGLVRFFKSEKKSMDNFLSEMKSSIKGFFKKILSFIQTGLSNFIGTIVSEIFGPIVSTIKKLASVIKQSISSLSEAIFYLLDKKNRNISFSIKIMQVGKIIIAGLTGITALGLGEVIEKGLGTILPALSVIQIPLLGSLANIIGIFMGAIVSGIIGAIAINLIEKMIKRQYEIEIVGKKIDKSNEMLKIQQKIIDLNENKVQKVKEEVNSSIVKRHKETSDFLRNTVNKIFSEKNKGIQRNKDNEENSNKEKFDEIDSILDELI